MLDLNDDCSVFLGIKMNNVVGYTVGRNAFHLYLLIEHEIIFCNEIRSMRDRSIIGL